MEVEARLTPLTCKIVFQEIPMPLAFDSGSYSADQYCGFIPILVIVQRPAESLRNLVNKPCKYAILVIPCNSTFCTSPIRLLLDSLKKSLNLHWSSTIGIAIIIIQISICTVLQILQVNIPLHSLNSGDFSAGTFVLSGGYGR